jgi:hypothetical protein
MRNKYIKILLLVFASGCTPWFQPIWAAENSGLHIITTEKQLADASSPVGYWEIALTYPQFRETKNSALESVNKQITDLVNRYSCQGPGDQTFTVEPIYSNNYVLSFYYEAMWMCAAMPSPDSRSGIINFNLETGMPLSIGKEFIDEAARERFIAQSNTTLKKEQATYCTPINNTSNALITEQGIKVKGASATHGEADCPVYVLIQKKEFPSFFRSDSILLK